MTMERSETPMIRKSNGLVQGPRREQYDYGTFRGSHEGKVMCDRLASAWVAFAKTSDPNNPHIPRWPSYDSATRATMVFDTDTRVENDPRGEIRKFWEQIPPPNGI